VVKMAVMAVLLLVNRVANAPVTTVLLAVRFLDADTKRKFIDIEAIA
jgi:hypothetical protein